MLHAFLDESYTSLRYYIAAAVGEADQWDCVSERLTEIRQRTHREHGTPLGIEFHAYELLNGEGDWAPLKGKHREAGSIYLAVLRAARSCGIMYLLRGLDILRLHARYKYPEKPHSIVLGHTLERLHERARDYHAGAPITVTADEIATQTEHVAQFESYQLVGTPGYRSSTLATIVPPIRFASSAAEDGLQLADFGVYAHRRRETVIERDARARAAMRRLTTELDAMTIHNVTWKP